MSPKRLRHLAIVAAGTMMGALVLSGSMRTTRVGANGPVAPGAANARHKPTPRTGVFAFDIYAEGDRLHLLEANYPPKTVTPGLYYRRATDDDAMWSAPVRVDAGATPPFTAYRGIDPQIAAAGQHLVAVWTTAGDDIAGYGTGPLATAMSADRGKTWRPGPNPADDGLMTAHEFIDVVADRSGVFHLFWIDDREEKRGLRRGLRYARSTDGGLTWTKNATLEPQICACCWVHARVDDRDGLYALFREVLPKPSDMRVFYSPDGGRAWESRALVARFDWQVYGCPHTTAGFAMTGAGEGRRLHALVQTGKENAEGIYYAASEDGGRHWSSPTRMADGYGRYADLAAAPTASGAASGARAPLAAVWQETRPDGAVIVGSLSPDDGKTWRTATPLSGAVGASAGYPRVVAWRHGFRVLWTEALANGSYKLVTHHQSVR